MKPIIQETVIYFAWCYGQCKCYA